MTIICPFGSAERFWGLFCCVNLEDFAGDLPGGFFWALFRTNMWSTNPAAQNPQKKAPRLKNKNPFCQEPALTIYLFFFALLLDIFPVHVVFNIGNAILGVEVVSSVSQDQNELGGSGKFCYVYGFFGR